MTDDEQKFLIKLKDEDEGGDGDDPFGSDDPEDPEGGDDGDEEF